MGKQLVDFDSDDSPLDFRNAFLVGDLVRRGATHS